MAELGQVRHDGNAFYVMLPQRFGFPPIVQARWMRVCPHDTTLCLQLEALETGTVIDHKALIERGEVVVVRYAPMQMTDGAFDRLLDAAELLEGRE